MMLLIVRYLGDLLVVVFLELALGAHEVLVFIQVAVWFVQVLLIGIGLCWRHLVDR